MFGLMHNEEKEQDAKPEARHLVTDPTSETSLSVPEDTEAEFQARLQAFQRSVRFRRIPGLLYIVSGLIGVAVSITFVRLFATAMSGPLALLLPLGLVAAWFYYLYKVVPWQHRARGMHTNPATRLAESGEVRALPVLLDTWVRMSDIKILYEVVPAVTQLLGYVHSHNADLLPARSRKQLRHLLNLAGIAVSGFQEPLYRQYYADFVVTLLDMIERTRDTEFLSAVRGLTTLHGNTEAIVCVREAARDCLATLEGTLHQQELPRTLLRPASVADAPEAELLRPAQGVTAPDAATLLRPEETSR